MNKTRAGEEDKRPLKCVEHLQHIGRVSVHEFKLGCAAAVRGGMLDTVLQICGLLGCSFIVIIPLTSHHLLQSGPRHYSASRKGKCQT